MGGGRNENHRSIKNVGIRGEVVGRALCVKKVGSTRNGTSWYYHFQHYF